MVTGTYISIITLNVNGINTPINRHRMADWIKKQEPTICCLQETHFMAYRHILIESEGIEKNISCKWKQQESGGSNAHIRQEIL